MYFTFIRFSAIALFLWFFTLCAACGCRQITDDRSSPDLPTNPPDTTIITEPIPEPEPYVPYSAEDITVTRELRFNKYTLEDSYPYKDTVRTVKWEQIRKHLALLEERQRRQHRWAVLQNYKNLNRKAPSIPDPIHDEYGFISDRYGVERQQAAPLYQMGDTLRPIRYGADGWPVRIIGTEGSFVTIEGDAFEGQYQVPERYVKELGDSVSFNHVIIVDRGAQHEVTLERTNALEWKARSVNPCTTGKKRPPYKKPTPLGTYLLQQKKAKMFYTKDGSNEIQGYAPWANRFHRGAYIHGVPTQSPTAPAAEYSPSLGTTPRSHMCVRNATSHAKFIYDNFPTLSTIVIVIE